MINQTLPHAVKVFSNLSSLLKQSPSKQIDELILSLYQVQLDGVLISTLLQPLKKETTPCVIFKIATISWNSFFSQNRDRSSLVDRNKTGVLVFEKRKFNVNVWLTSFHNIFFTKLIHASSSATRHFRKTGSSQIMMNISEHGNFLNSLRFILWVTFETSFFTLFIHIMYICSLVYRPIRVNSVFLARWLASSEVIIQSVFLTNNRSALDYSDFVESAILELLSVGSIVSCTSPPDVVNLLSVSVQSSGKKRLILDLRHVNFFVSNSEIKVDDAQSMLYFFIGESPSNLLTYFVVKVQLTPFFFFAYVNLPVSLIIST